MRSRGLPGSSSMLHVSSAQTPCLLSREGEAREDGELECVPDFSMV
jgi:hypothetical protein